MAQPAQKVEIGLPVYNGEKFLERALAMLLGQSYGEFELIISDNASTDGTEQICRKYADLDPRIRYFRQDQNIGAVANFNWVFENSNCEYFKWAAVDDLCSPTYLEKVVKILDDDPACIWCHSRSSHIDAAGNLLEDADCCDVSYEKRGSPIASKRFEDVVLGKGGCIDSYGLMRSEAIRQTDLFMPLYGAEKIFMAELALIGTYREIPETLFFVRVDDTSSGSLATAEEQQQFVDPNGTAKVRFARLSYLKGYLKAIRRSAPGSIEVAKSTLVILRWLFQISKWKSILEKAIKGQGVGGGNIDRLKRLKDREKSSSITNANSVQVE
jgi:glycosyltransferase involved in cell wall biosynthesis